MKLVSLGTGSITGWQISFRQASGSTKTMRHQMRVSDLEVIEHAYFSPLSSLSLVSWGSVVMQTSWTHGWERGKAERVK